MPWNQRDIMSLRKEFIIRLRNEEKGVARLCREYKISRKTAYKWINRHEEEGVFGLLDRPRRPSHTPTRISDNVAEEILLLRDKHPAWGAKKLRQVLINEGFCNLPSLSSFNRILKRSNKINPEQADKRKHFIRFERAYPNELWQMDFKGHFTLKNGTCHPLTILDDCSRYSICLRACVSENEASVRDGLEEAFYTYGLPEAMTMDNGSPWKGYPTQRLSNLTVWLMRLGIKVGHSRPNHPQTQGKDERFHRTFKEEVLKYHTFQDLAEAQEHFDEWRKLYNERRPHEALNMLCPVQKYTASTRHYVSKLPEIEYLPEDRVVKVGKNGEICFGGKRQYVGSHLKFEHVALRYRADSKWDIYYVKSRIGSFSENV
jgi:transposase InsO family protein